MKQMTYKRLLLTMVLMLFVAFLLISCAPKQADNSTDAGTDEEASAITLPAWSTESDCVSCHEVEASSENDAENIYSLHVPAGVTCLTCHTDDSGELTEAHSDYATAEPPAKLMTTKVAESTCLSCHDENELAASTATSTALTDANGAVVNPHSLPEIEKHEDNIDCASCHKMHLQDSSTEQAQEKCLSCHHMQVYECGTCHE